MQNMRQTTGDAAAPVTTFWQWRQSTRASVCFGHCCYGGDNRRNCAIIEPGEILKRALTSFAVGLGSSSR